MIIGKTELKRLVQNRQLISVFDDNCLSYCSYKLRIGKIVLPESGLVLKEKLRFESLGKIKKILLYIAKCITPDEVKKPINDAVNSVANTFVLKPRQIALFETAEIIKMPNNISGIYTALNTVAQKGILLINASIVEPHYHGPLSGILVNISSHDFVLSSDMQIAKICFNKVNEDVIISENVDNEIEEVDYIKRLSHVAKEKYSDSFLDINSIMNEIEGRFARQLRKGIYFSGTIIAILLFIATFEPYIYNHVWGRVSVSEWQEMRKIDETDSLKKKIINLEKEIHLIKTTRKSSK